MDVTRRKLAQMLAAGVPIAAATAQTPAPAEADDDLKIQRDQMRNNAQQLAKVALPMATEPAVHFRP
jgi:hypothetical protein